VIRKEKERRSNVDKTKKKLFHNVAKRRCATKRKGRTSAFGEEEQHPVGKGRGKYRYRKKKGEKKRGRTFLGSMGGEEFHALY